MCVIVHVPADKTLFRRDLELCYDNNPDGWGIMYALDGKIHAYKDVSNFHEFWKVWRDLPKGIDRAAHFRIKTHGEINRENCHPFKINDNMYAMHNGTINTPMLDVTMSDTYNYVNYVLAALVAGWPNAIEDIDFHTMVEDMIGGSRFLLLNSEGKFARLKKHSWHEREGVYYSNLGSIRSQTYSYRNDNRSTTTYKGSRDTIAPYSNPQSEFYERHYQNEGFGDDDYCPYHATGVGGFSEAVKRATEVDNTKSKTLLIQNTSENTVSDLYSGNKTDAEGQEYIDACQEAANGSTFSETAEAVRKALDDDAVDDEVEEIELNEDFVLDFQNLQDMKREDMMDLLADYPHVGWKIITGMLDTMADHYITEIDYSKVPTNAVVDKASNIA